MKKGGSFDQKKMENGSLKTAEQIIGIPKARHPTFGA
jgi:hypothetical protein